MSSKTRKQAHLMAARAHGAGYASCPPAKVAREFNQADKDTGILKSNLAKRVRVMDRIARRRARQLAR